MPINLAQNGNDGAPGGDNAGKSDAENAGGNSGAGDAGKGSNSGANNQGNDWLSGLSQENRELAGKKGWKTLDDALKGYKSLESAYSGRDPNNQQTPQYKRSDYSITAPADAKDIGFDDSVASKFLDYMAESQADPKMAKGAFEWYAQATRDVIASTKQAKAQAAEENFAAVERDLTKAWGSPNTPQFARNVEMARRAIENLDPGLGEALVSAGVIVKEGKAMNVANAAIMKALAKVGAAMFAEDTMFSAKAADVNPFDAKTRDTAAQGRIIKEDPDRAEMLIRSAGSDATRMWKHWLDKRKR